MKTILAMAFLAMAASAADAEPKLVRVKAPLLGGKAMPHLPRPLFALGEKGLARQVGKAYAGAVLVAGDEIRVGTGRWIAVGLEKVEGRQVELSEPVLPGTKLYINGDTVEPIKK